MDIVISEEQGVRNLHFGSPWIQGAMRIARPYALELEYTREMMASLLFTGMDAPPRRALMVGLGVGALPKFVWKHCPAAPLMWLKLNPLCMLQPFSISSGPETTLAFKCTWAAVLNSWHSLKKAMTLF